MTPKIADFGFSETLVKEDEHVRDHVGPKGTPRYMAPEIMLGKVLDKSIDVYAYGIILYELMTGKLSFDTYTHYETFSRDICYNRVRPVVQPADSVPAPLVDLMVRCWDERPEVRPTFEDVCADLRQAYYEAFIPQEQPRSFWLENFEDEDAIPYEDLRKLAAARFINLEPLKDVLCDAQDAISMKHFSRLYEWFGPWFCFGEPESTAIINELHAIVAQPWFHGFITKDESTVRLTGNAFGVFLVRLSDTTPGCPYTISYVARTSMGAAPSNFRIKKISHYPARYEASGREFLSLNDIINAYAEAGVLTMACSKSPITTVY